MDIASLLEQFDTLRNLDSGYRVFGSSKHRYQFNAPASPQRVREFEVQHSVSLPADYRQYLVEVSNGGAGPNYGLIDLERAAVGHIPSRPFPIPELESGSDVALSECAEIPGAVWLSDNGCATFDLMAVNGDLKGSVWTVLEDENHFRCSSFERWYAGWLQSAIRTINRETLLKSIETGMHIDEIRAVFGDEMVPVSEEQRRSEYWVGFWDCNAFFFFNSKDRLIEIKHHAQIINPSVR